MLLLLLLLPEWLPWGCCREPNITIMIQLWLTHWGWQPCMGAASHCQALMQCAFWCLAAAGAPATCPVVLRNQGNMRVVNVSVLGDSNTCSKPLMAPDETLFCNMSRVLVQSEYEHGAFTLRATNISGAAHGPLALPSDSAYVSSTVQPTLLQVPELNVSVAVNRTTVYKAGDTVLYTITAVGAAGSGA